MKEVLSERLKMHNPAILDIETNSFYVRMKRKKSGKTIDFRTWLGNLLPDFDFVISTYWTDGVNVIFIIKFK